MVDARPLGSIAVVEGRQVDGLAHLARLEQRRIAIGIDLGNLVLHRIDGQLILTGLGIGMDCEAIARGMHHRRIHAIQAVNVQRVALTDGQVVLVADNPGGIVTL